MTIDPRYVVSISASSLHAAAAMLGGATLVDPKMSEALEGEVAALASDLAAVGLLAGDFFEHAVPLAVRFDAPRAWAEVLVTKALGPHKTT